MLAVRDRVNISTALFCEDHSQGVELNAGPELQSLYEFHTRLFHVGEVAFAVYMTLSVNIRVAYFNGMIVLIFFHRFIEIHR